MYILEYSPSQDAFHLCTPKDREFNEAVLKVKGIESDWKVIEEFGDDKEANNYIHELRINKASL